MRGCLLALAALLLAGCGGSRLDEQTARAAIEAWAKSNVIKEVGPRDSMQPPACLDSLVRAGYMKQVGPNSLFYESTGKLQPVANAHVHPGFFMLPLLKTEIVSVAPPVQVPGEKSAQVRFTYRHLPGQPGVDISCAKGGLPQQSTAQFVLTDGGWKPKFKESDH